MKIYETAVRKPISTILIFIGVMVLGLFSLNNLSVDMYPEMDYPAVSVITIYQGANASDIETNITRVLEDNLNTVSNLKKLTSTSSDNMSVITLEMEWGTNTDEASNDVRDVVGRIQPYLPDDADAPMIMKFSTSMIPVMVLSVTSEESYNGLGKLLDDKMVNVLNRIDGVGSVTLMGQPVRQIQVNVDPARLEAYNISVEQLGQVIAGENVNVAGGFLDIGNNKFTIKSDGEFKDSHELERIVVSSRDGRSVYLSDVAVVKDTLAKATMDSRIEGKRTVIVMVQKQSGANTVDIAQKVNAMLPRIGNTLPPDVKIDLLMDGSEEIVDSIDSLSETVMFAFLFVILVVLFFLGRWRATFIICLTIPVSLIVSFIYLYMTGNTLNIISLSSLSIAIGMVVDDAIVVLENITKHIEKGSDPKEASVYATNEVWLAVIATTLTIVAVFMPLTLTSGIAGIMFKQLGWIVSLVIVVSTVAAITLTPMLTSLMLKAKESNTYKGLGKIFKPVDRFLDRLDSGYAAALAWSVRHRAMIIISSVLIFASSLLLLFTVPFEMFTPSDNSIIATEVKLQQNIAVEYTAGVGRRIDSIFRANYPEIKLMSTRAGEADGSNAMAALMSSGGSYVIINTIRMVPMGERTRSIFEIGDLMRKDLAGIPEIREFTVTPGAEPGGSIGTASSIEVKVFGNDIDLTNDIAIDLRDTIARIPGAVNVELSRDDLRPEYNLNFDPDKLAAYGLNSSTAANYVRNRINGLTASQYREDGDEYDIVVRYDEQFRRTLADVENIVVYNPAGVGVRVREIATIDEVFAPPAIERENRQRLVKVNVSLADGVALGTLSKAISGVVNNYEIPSGVYLEIGGSVADQQEAFGDLGTLLVLVILLVYIVMATQFESFKMPFIIMVTILFAFTGVFLALALTGTPLSLVAFIGAIMLVGIVVKNGIVMVDYTNLLRERGSSINQSVVAAGKSRLRPVLMTSLTTILGMLPLAIGGGEGSEVWRPMGVAIIGGLTFSTLLTLIVVPVLYSSFVGAGLRKRRISR